MYSNNKRKHYIKIDRDTGSNIMYRLINEVESDGENDIENLTNNSDTEFVWENNL